jgi:serine protein kinase
LWIFFLALSVRTATLIRRSHELSLQEYLDLCKSEPSAYATAAERMLLAIGEPELVDTGTTRACRASFPTRSSRSTRRSATSTAWRKPSSRSCPIFRHAAQGLEERKQILYLLGPVGGGKSSLAEKLKHLMEKCRSTPSRARR